MSILTASNPLILALVLSLYHVSKESYRILKLKKILICSTIGVFTLYDLTVPDQSQLWQTDHSFWITGMPSAVVYKY